MVAVGVGEIYSLYTQICSILDEAKENNRMVKELKKCFSLLKASVVNLHNRKLNQGVLKEMKDCFDEVRDFVVSFQGQGWFKKYFWKRSENTSESNRLIKLMFRINELLQTDLLVELNRCEEGHRKFRDEVIDKLEQNQKIIMKEVGATKKDVNQLKRLLERERISEAKWVIRREDIKTTKKILGKGGMGIVHLAKYQGMEVAFKESKVEFDSTNQALKEMELFKKELTTSVSLRHENVVRVFGGAMEPNVFIVMGYCSLGSLSDVIDDCDTYTIGNKHRLIWSKQLANGLHFLHKKFVIHHDVKSQNVLVDERGVAKWADFGLASTHTSSTFSQVKVSTGGTPEWSPPEQFSGEYGYKSDVWGLGLVMYHLVEMRMPFEGVSKNVLRDAIQRGRLKYDKMDETDPILRETIRLCLNTDRTKRPKAGQLAEGLDKIAPRLSPFQFLKQLGLGDEAEEFEEPVGKAEARVKADRRDSNRIFKLPQERILVVLTKLRSIFSSLCELLRKLRSIFSSLCELLRMHIGSCLEIVANMVKHSPGLVVVLAALWNSSYWLNGSGQPPFLKEVWTTLPDMRTTRNYFDVAFGDGKLFAVGVLVVVLAALWNSSYWFNSLGQPPFLKEVWKELPDMNIKRMGLGVAIWDGKLFAVGGTNGNYVLKSGEHLDLKNVDAGWKKLPDMNTERLGLGVAVGDGKLFAVGGIFKNRHKSGEYLDLKNVDAGWKKLPDMNITREAVAFGDGKLFAVGGASDISWLKSGEYLDLKKVNEGWKALPDMRTKRLGLGVAVGDGKLFAVGGNFGKNRHKSGEYLDLKNVDAGWKKLPDMNITREAMGVAVGDGKLFAVGGASDKDVPHKYGEYLDLKAVDAGWKELPDMNIKRIGLGMAVGDGKLFAVGGYDGVFHKSGEHLRIAT